MMEDPAAHINVYTYNTLAFFTGNLYDIDLLRLCHKCSKFDFFYDTSIRCTIYSFFLLKEYLIYFSACIDYKDCFVAMHFKNILKNPFRIA